MKKIGILSKSKSNFQNFLPQSAWSLENFEKSADLGPLPAEIPRKLIGHFLEIFEKLAKKGQITPTFCQNNEKFSLLPVKNQLTKVY